MLDRINEARKRETSLDEQLLVSLMGHSAVWWSLICGRLEPRSGSHVYALAQLASWMEERGWRKDPRNEHRKVPEEDFPGGEDHAPVPKIPTSSANVGTQHLPSRRGGAGGAKISGTPGRNQGSGLADADRRNRKQRRS